MDDEEDYDETYVRPVNAVAVPREPNVVYHAACEITTATGNAYRGFVSICNGILHNEAPVIVGGKDEYWPLDSAYCQHYIEKFKAFFGVRYEALLPIQWRLLVRLASDSTLLSGSYHGG